MNHCLQFTTHLISSCEYVVYSDDSNRAWLVDCGEYQPIQQWLYENHKILSGIFLTHAHCDHSAGVIEALRQWPELVVYTSSNQGLTYLQDERLNQSRYVVNPFKVPTSTCLTLSDGQQVALTPTMTLIAWQTPGHSPDSLTFRIGEWLFTGDAHIPGFSVVTRVKGADKLLAQKSEERILAMIIDNIKLCPGHSSHSGSLFHDIL